MPRSQKQKSTQKLSRNHKEFLNLYLGLGLDTDFVLGHGLMGLNRIRHRFCFGHGLTQILSDYHGFILVTD